MTEAAAATDYELLTLLEKEVGEEARASLLPFAIYTRPFYEPNWHHEALCRKLDRFARGEIKRLMVFMPPRHGKSELVSRCLPAFLMGRDPDAQIIAVSYSSDLAGRMNRDVQRIIDSDEYQRLFPDTKLAQEHAKTYGQKYMRTSDLFEVVGRYGTYRCSGIGGGITGMGARWVIVDDPIKNQDEAHSITYRDKVWDFYTSTLYTRLEADSGILVTLTRWHEDDLAGRLLKLAKEDSRADQWDQVVWPAIKESPPTPDDPRDEGEALWESRFPAQVVERNKANGTYVWNALFQQRPAPPEGNIINRDWFRYYDELPAKTSSWLQSWDLTFKASKGGSFVVGQVWCRSQANFYLVDQYRARPDFPATIEAMMMMFKRWPEARLKLVEDAANGPAVIASLRDKVPGIVAVAVGRATKESRLHAVSPMIESGNVYLPRKAPWLGDFIEEVVSFPNAPNDDQVDTMTQALNRYGGRTAGILDLDIEAGKSAMEERYY